MTLYLGFGESVSRKVGVDWDIVKRGTVVIGRYLDPLILDLINVAGGASLYPVIFDFKGLYADVDFGSSDLSRYLVGVDIPFNVLTPPKHIDKHLYFDILSDSLSIISRFLGIAGGIWRPLFIELMHILMEREGCITNELVVSELEVLRNESGGVDKHGYSLLYNILKLVTYTQGVRKIYFVDEPIDYELVFGDSALINYSSINSFYSRLFIYIVSLVSSLLFVSDRLNVMFCGDHYIPYFNSLLLDIIHFSVGEMPYLMHFYRFNKGLMELPLYNIFIDNSRLAYLWIRRGFDPLKYNDYSTHHMISMGRLLPLRVEGRIDRVGIQLSVRNVPNDYSPDDDLVREVLSRVRDLGGVGLEGIYMYMRGRGRGEVYMAVDWLWRNGFLRRERLGGGYVYKITIKGLMRLREDGGDG